MPVPSKDDSFKASASVVRLPTLQHWRSQWHPPWWLSDSTSLPTVDFDGMACIMSGNTTCVDPVSTPHFPPQPMQGAVSRNSVDLDALEFDCYVLKLRV